MMKGRVLGFAVFFLCLPAFVMGLQASGGRSEKGFSWSPDQQQVRSWLNSQGLPSPAPLPVVSLKVALKDGQIPVDLQIDEETWLPAASGVSGWKGRQTAVLGARGVFRGVPYQEVLLYPLKDSGKRGTVLVLNRIKFRLSYNDSPESRTAAVENGRISPYSDLFVNPADAIERKTINRAMETPLRSRLVTGSPLRVEISQDGIYRLDYNYLETHGFNPGSVDPMNVHLYRRGIGIPIFIEGPIGSTLGSSNAVIFYGRKASIKDRPVFNGGDFTDEAAYWLTSDSNPGLRMAQVAVAPTSGYTQPSSTTCTDHFETNDYFYCRAHIRPNGDLWFWSPYLSNAQPESYTLSLPHAVAADDITLEAIILGFGTGNHSLSATLNGGAPSSGPDPATWSGSGIETIDWTFAAPNAGSNTLTLTVNGSGDYQIPDYFDVTYSRTFDADLNVLTFDETNQDAQYACPGFSSTPYILDISNRDAATGVITPVLLTGSNFASGIATFEMAYNSTVTSRKVALSAAPLLPDKAEITTVRDLSDSTLGADFLIITHPDFHPQGSDGVWQQYLARRRSQMSVEVVDIQEVYDNYSYGFLDPTAIKTFLSEAAAHWSTVPRYVLLIGDGSYDYKNYMNDPTFKDWVPTMMFEDLSDSTYMGRYPSDAWFADVDGDGFPNIAVGRIPVRGYTEFAGVLTKIMAYEDQTLTGNWYKGGLFVADTYTQSWEQEFETYNDWLQTTYLSPPWQTQHLYFHDAPYNGTDTDAFASDIRDAWSGAALIHYAGHSGINFWGKYHDFFTAFPSRNCQGVICQDSDVDLLPAITTGANPYAPLPFVINSSCYNAAFDEVVDPSLMEALTARTDGGCIASSGFSTIAYPYEEEAFNNALLDLFSSRYKVRTVGDLVDAGRFASPSSVPRLTMGDILLGDPTQELILPAPAAPPNLTAAPLDSAVDLDWSASPDPVSFYSIYRSTDAQQTWTLLAQVPSTIIHYNDGSLTNGSTYYYYLTSVDADGFEGPPGNIASATPGVFPCSITCTAAASPSLGAAPLNVSFTATATASNCTGTPTYDWDFGDGSAHSTDQNPTHTFSSDGTYDWTMTVSVDNRTCTKTGTITVSAESCTITCTATASPASGTSPLNVSFSATATPSNCTGLPVFDWDFGDGSAHSSTQNPTHTYNSTGTYNWTMTASVDAQMCVKTGSVIVTAACMLTCTASASPAAGTVPLDVSFTATATSSNCTGTPVYDWDFDDGSSHSTEQNPNHLILKPGVHSWNLTVTQDNETCLKTGSLSVVNPPAVKVVKKRTSPFRVEIKGANLQDGITVYVGGRIWTEASRKNASRIVLKKGSALKALFPGSDYVPIRLVNPDGGELTILYNRSSNVWQYEGTTTIHPPAVSLVRKKRASGHHFKVIVKGVNFDAGISIFVGGEPWSNFTLKNNSKINLFGGSILKNAFPVGATVPIRLLNADGCETTVTYDRGADQWEFVE